jgi:UDP-glucose 4-epimerase
MKGFDVVTGGAGFIGSHLTQKLLSVGRTVRVIDNLSTGRPENLAHLKDEFGGRIEFVRADIRQINQLSELCQGVEVIYHLAAMVSVQQSVEEPYLCEEINIGGTLNVLSVASRCGARKAVLASTCAVYGDSPELPKRESMLPEPKSPYAVSKYADELFGNVYSGLYGLSLISLRYFNVFGPRQDPSSDYAAVVPRFITRMLSGKPPIIYGDGGQTRDFVFVENVAEANLRAAGSQETGVALNVGSGVQYSLNQLVGVLNGILGVDFEPEYREARPGDVRHSEASVDLARERIGFELTTDFREGLERTTEYFAHKIGDLKSGA